MLVEVKVPMLSESVAEATLLSWHKKQGDAVRRDENLIDIETDKVVLELPAPADGILVKVAKGDGSTVVAEEVIAAIDTDGKADTAPAPTDPAAKAVAPGPIPAPAARAENVTALPAARKMMADNAIAVDTVAGTGRGGRVTKGDVIAHMEGGQPAPQTVATLESGRARWRAARVVAAPVRLAVTSIESITASGRPSTPSAR